MLIGEFIVNGELLLDGTALPLQSVVGQQTGNMLEIDAHGSAPRRLMTDHAFAYVKKVERFHQTMAREWAYGLAYRSHRHRNRALPDWLEHYNTARPHSSLDGRAPISCIHNVCG